MVLKKTRARLATLYDALMSDKRAAIKPKHVEQILDKINRKQRKILDELETETDDAARHKLERKLAVVEEQRARGEELLRLVRGEGG